MRIRKIAAMGLLGLGMSGCASLPEKSTWQPPRELGEEFSDFRPPRDPRQEDAEPMRLEKPTGTLTLREALTQGLMKNPELKAFAWQVRAAEARVLQAGLLPNPALGVALEDFGGTGESSGIENSAATVSLSQLVELGGKRMKRTRIAGLESDLATWDYEAKRLDVLTEITVAYIEVLTAQQRIALYRELVTVARQMQESVAERVLAGKVSPLEETKANIALASSQIALERSRRNQEAARIVLAALWGSAEPGFEAVDGALDEITAIPTVRALTRHISQNPDIARWVTELAHRESVVDGEESKRAPDIEVGGGIRRFEETNAVSLLLEISVPIPLHDGNQGGILEAKYNVAKGQEERRSAEMQVRMALAQAYASLSGSHVEVGKIREDILKGAQSAFDAANEGYRQGKFNYLDVLDAQRTLFEVRAQYVEVLAEFHKSVAQIERLVGLPLEQIKE